MKLNKRIKSAIVQWIIINIIISIIFIMLLLFKVIPGFNIIEANKEKLSVTMGNINDINKKWVDFTTFKSLIKDLNVNDDYTLFIIKKLDKFFYDTNFINKWSDSYTNFINDRVEEINKDFQEWTYNNKIESIDKILPTYISSWKGNNILSDFLFINYIENLLFSFNLELNSYNIGIPGLFPEKWYDNGKKNDIINTGIYSIPMKYIISWKKKDILEFIHFIKKVWNISIEEDEIVFYEDDVVNRNINGDKVTKDYNLYKHQIMDIKSISMKEYIDSSAWITEERNVNQSLEEYIKESQWREKFEVNIEFDFYVKGLPTYDVLKLLRWEKDIEGESNTFEWIIPRQKRIAAMVDKKITEVTKTIRAEKSSDILVINTRLNDVKNAIDIIWKALKVIENNIIKTGVNQEIYNNIVNHNNKINYIELILNNEIEKLKIINSKRN